MKKLVLGLVFWLCLIAPFLFPINQAWAQGCDLSNEIPTAIGCINVRGPTSVAESILGVATGVGGGVAILLILYGAFQVITAAGSPDKIQAGQQLITSAIMGLLVIIFAVFILRVIGQDILKIFP